MMKPKVTDSIQSLRDSPFIFLETLSGSRAYGLETEKSDTDIRGIFILPPKDFFGLSYTDIVADSRNDTVFFELRKIVKLLLKNNPTMLELLASPEDCIRVKHPLMDLLKPEIYISKICENTFAGYAMEQIRKARGLSKKILNPMSEVRKGVLDFCYVTTGTGSMPLQKWLAERSLRQKDCGLLPIPNMDNTYYVFVDTGSSSPFKGIIQDENSNDVSQSQPATGNDPAGILHFNKNGFSQYAKDYKEYWEWVGKRNDVRFTETITHQKNYDAKNLMHTFRVLDMASEIARFKEIRVRRENREYYLDIRKGKFDYEDLLKTAEDKLETVREEFRVSDLPDAPDREKINDILVHIREAFYKSLNEKW